MGTLRAAAVTAWLLIAPTTAQSLFLGACPARAPEDPFVRLTTNVVRIADFDGNGRPDLFFGNSGSNSRQLLLHDGTPFFAPRAINNTAAYTCFAATEGDIDRDGDLDLLLLTSDSSVSTIEVLINTDGLGNFGDQTATRLPVTFPDPSALVLGDIDSDGDLDLIVGHGTQQGAQNRRYLNDGAGNFVEATQGGLPYVNDVTSALALADVDRDGDLDLITGNQGQSQLALNNGQGQFISVTATHMPTLSRFVQSVRPGDIDGDGDLDLLLPCYTGLPSVLLLNDGSGRFTDVSNRFQSSWAKDGLLVDVDRDGDLDIFFALYVAVNELYLNNGQGTFTRSTGRIPAVFDSSRAAAAGDLDGDGDQDLVVGNAFITWEREPDGRNFVLRNDGAGTFSDQRMPVRCGAGARLPEIYDMTNVMLLIDPDRDGDLDLLVANDFGQQNRFHRNDGNGNFTDATAAVLPADGDNTVAAVSCDVDRDGIPDLVLGNYDGQNRIYRGRADGTFVDETATRMPPDTDPTVCVAAGDLDGDSDLDLVFGNNGQNRVYVNDGSGVFTDNTQFALPPGGGLTTYLSLADFDGDSDLDLMDYTAALRVWRNNGQGIFTDISTAALGGLAADVWAAVPLDADRDGDQDLFVEHYTPVSFNGIVTGKVLLNAGNFTFTAGPSVVASNYSQPASSLAVADLQGDGYPDIVASRTYTVSGRYAGGGPCNYYLNAQGTAWTAYELAPTLEYTRTASCGDIDGDGDLDVLLGNKGNNGAQIIPRPGEQNRLHMNTTRQVDVPEFARVGRSLTIDAYAVSGAGPRLTATMLGFAPTLLPLPPFGTLRVDPTSAVLLPPVSTTTGRARLTVPIPPNAALAGLQVYLQSLVEGRDAQGGQIFRLSNLLVESIYQ